MKHKITTILTVCLLAPILVFSQTSKKSEPKKKKETKVQVKILTEDNGVSINLDTSFANLDEANAAIKKLTKRKGRTESKDAFQEDLSIIMEGDVEAENEMQASTRPRIKIYGHGRSKDAAKALDRLRVLNFELPDMPEIHEMEDMPEIRMFQHDWAMENGNQFSLGVTEVDKDVLNKLGIKAGETEELLEDLSISGSGSKNKIKVSFEVLEPAKMSIRVLNLDGKEIYSQNHARYIGRFSNAIDFGKRIKGVYYLVISVEGKNLVRKITREVNNQ